MLFEMSKKVEAKVEETQERLEKLGYPRINISCKMMTLGPGYAGRAWGAARMIAISPDYYREYPERILNITVPHEVVHIYVGKYYPRARQAHGPEFRHMMNLLGLEGKTYHDMILKDGPNRSTKTKTRYIYVTPSGKECLLTKGQHTKAITGRASYSVKGERLAYSGSVTKVK